MGKLCLVFLHQHWRSATQLYTAIRDGIDYYSPSADQYLLPDTLIRGIDIDPAFLAEGVGGQTYNYMRLIASQISASIIAGLTIQEQVKQMYFRVFDFSPRPDLKFEVQESILLDKYQFYYQRRCCFKCNNLLVCVCCDLRLPIALYSDAASSTVIFIGNSPAVDYETWRALLRTRSLEISARVIGCLRLDDSGVVDDMACYDSSYNFSVPVISDYKCVLEI